ncbi:MAG TPA: DUF86 domain-containing protein [Oscillospiraceae bacterium]|mgnify:CR=1 FL=1|jgi:uncharacterized protein with HEPN domain|nr:DUF86 domain-containing protein [Oscillospiraceae bacterium]
MKRQKDNHFYLDRIIKDIDFIIRNMNGVTYEALQANEVLLDSMIFRLIQISENSKKLSEEFKQNFRQVPWTDISGLRNRLVHDYTNVDLTIVYKTVSEDIPNLKVYFESIE